MRHLDRLDGQGPSQLGRLPWSKGPEANPRFESASAKMKKVEEQTGERNSFFGGAKKDLPILEHQAVNDRWQAIDMVGVNMGQQDDANLARVELHLLNFLDGTARAIDENKVFPVPQKKRGIISRRRGNGSPRSQKEYLGHRVLCRLPYIKENPVKIKCCEQSKIAKEASPYL